MGKLMKYLGRYKLQCLLVLVLLVVQAVCDLALPDYTADIVDTGIMQKGVDRVSPAVISEESMDSVKLFMKEDEYAYVKDCYDLVDSVKDTDALPLKDKTPEGKVYKRRDLDDQKLDMLDVNMKKAIAVCYMAAQTDMDKMSEKSKENGSSERIPWIK